MQNLQQQAEFYRLTVKVMSYILSGSSHVGFLRNCPGNPYLSVAVCPLSQFNNLAAVCPDEFRQSCGKSQTGSIPSWRIGRRVDWGGRRLDAWNQFAIKGNHLIDLFLLVEDTILACI